MNITLLTVGSLKESWWRDAVREYEKRLSAYCRLKITEVRDEKTPDGASEAAEEQMRQKAEGTSCSLSAGPWGYPRK